LVYRPFNRPGAGAACADDPDGGCWGHEHGDRRPARNRQPTHGRGWRKRFARERVDGLFDEPRPGAPRTISDDEIAETIQRTLETMPVGATHWSLRSMAKAVGHAPSTIHRIWKAFGL